MPQATLPLFTPDMTIINSYIGVLKRDGKVYYFNGSFPFYHHLEDSRDSFKNIVCQMISNGRATRGEISKAFHIPARSISRWLSTYEKEGDGCFFKKKTIPVSAFSPPK
jgi:hypothetical protein